MNRPSIPLFCVRGPRPRRTPDQPPFNQPYRPSLPFPSLLIASVLLSCSLFHPLASSRYGSRSRCHLQPPARTLSLARYPLLAPQPVTPSVCLPPVIFPSFSTVSTPKAHASRACYDRSAPRACTLHPGTSCYYFLTADTDVRQRCSVGTSTAEPGKIRDCCGK